MMREGEDHILYTTRDTAEQQDTRARVIHKINYYKYSVMSCNCN